MSKTKLEAIIRKIRREGFAPDGASICRASKNAFKVNFRKDLFEGSRTLYVGLPDDPRYRHWKEMIERRNKLKQCVRALKTLKSVNLAKEKTSVEWYTPSEFVEMARSVLGAIDLDPASNPTAQGWVKAGQFYTKDDDGLKQPWHGRVWCNPPYSKFSRLFLERGLQFYRAGDVAACIFLLNRTGAAWYVDLLEQFDAVCQVRRRISFISPGGEPKKSPQHYNDFLYLGPDVRAFEQVFSGIGRVTG
ncbi:MAG: DNA N-6-adenine-methyltransferase [Cyanobacteria bacterium P01_A01_bin.123]